MNTTFKRGLLATALTLAVSSAQAGVTLSDIDFVNYAPPGGDFDPTYELFGQTNGELGVGSGAAEPTLGIPWFLNENDGDDDLTKVMFIAGLQTVRMSFNDCPSPAVSTWEDVSVPFHLTSLDPILETDRVTGRTLSSQLLGKTSLLGVSDDLGESWLPSTGAGINSGVDHQTIGHGPFSDSDPLNFLNSFPTAFYYASQDIAVAQAAISRDGGMTFGLAVPMYSILDCGSVGALHGHVQVSPLDGDVYVPTGTCPVAQSGVAVSENGGLTWRVEGVPGTQRGDDPGAGIDEAGNVYFATCDGDRTPIVSVRDADTDSWQSSPTSLSGPIQFEQCVFPTVVAGSEGRAAVAFLGSTTPGAGTDAGSNFPGSFFMYVAVTYDKGQNWEITNVTPNDPVQRGEVCLAGTACPSNRNLLDFNDIQIDEIGRVLVAYADGCIGGCVDAGPNSGTDAGRIARQQFGTKGLLADFDSVLDPVAGEPHPPYVDSFRSGNSVDLNWSTPFDGNSPLTGFDIFRKPLGGTFPASPIASVGAGQRTFTDNLPAGSGDVCYQVVSVNAEGSARGCFETCP